MGSRLWIPDICVIRVSMLPWRPKKEPPWKSFMRYTCIFCSIFFLQSRGSMRHSLMFLSSSKTTQRIVQLPSSWVTAPSTFLGKGHSCHLKRNNTHQTGCSCEQAYQSYWLNVDERKYDEGIMKLIKTSPLWNDGFSKDRKAWAECKWCPLGRVTCWGGACVENWEIFWLEWRTGCLQLLPWTQHLKCCAISWGLFILSYLT